MECELFQVMLMVFVSSNYYIHVQPYAISGQKCLVVMKKYPLLCNVNGTKHLRREVAKSGR